VVSLVGINLSYLFFGAVLEQALAPFASREATVEWFREDFNLRAVSVNLRHDTEIVNLELNISKITDAGRHAFGANTTITIRVGGKNLIIVYSHVDMPDRYIRTLEEDFPTTPPATPPTAAPVAS